MSAVVDLVDDVVRGIPVVNQAWDIVKDVHDAIWQAIGKPVLEMIFALLGIEDENVISAQVNTQRLIPDDIAEGLLTRVALDHQAAPERGVIEHLTTATSMIRGKYTSYYNKGETNFDDGLPETTIRGTTVDVNLLDQAITQAHGPFTDLAVNFGAFRVPDKFEYTANYLKWELGLDYRAWDMTIKNGFTYPNERYQVQTIDYVFATDTYDVNYNLQEDTTITTSTRTTITITNIDPTTDNKNTVVETIVETVGDISGPISTVVTPVSDVDEVIPINTEVDSVVTVVDSVTFGNSVLDSGTMNIPAYPPINYFIGQFAFSNDVNPADPAEYHYFLYDPADNTYPYLTDSNVYTTQLDMLPIVSLRNNGVSITSDKNSTRYLQSKEILNTIGIDVDDIVEGIEESPSINDVMDAFIYFAASPQDTHPVVSRALYDMFAFVYDDSAIYNAPDDPTLEGAYITTITEGAYNASVTWKTQSKSIIVNSIGPVGTYQHEVVGSSLIVRKQETAGAYVEYTFNTMTTITMIDRAGADDIGITTVSISDEQFVIPLSQFYVDQLTPMEQTILFSKSLHLSIYAAQVTHLEYYETAAFGNFIQIVAFVVMVIVIVLSWGSASQQGVSFYTWAASMAQTIGIGLAVTYALTKVFESTDNEISRAIATAAAIYTVARTGDTSGLARTGLLTANMLSQAVMIDVGIESQRLADEASMFQQLADKRQEELEKEREALDTGLDIDYVTGLARVSPNQGYIEGIDSFMYKAKGGIQYDYSTLYDYNRQHGDMYDNAFRLDLNKSLS